MKLEWKRFSTLAFAVGLVLAMASCKPEQESAGDLPADHSDKAVAIRNVPRAGTVFGEESCDVPQSGLNGTSDGGVASPGTVPAPAKASNARNFPNQNAGGRQTDMVASGDSGNQQVSYNSAVQSLRPNRMQGSGVRSGFSGSGGIASGGGGNPLPNNGEQPSITMLDNNSPNVQTPNGNSPSGNEVASIENSKEPVVEQPEEEDISVNVVQYGYYWEDGLLMVNYSMELSKEMENIPPNGLILCQEIPEGWEVVAADPQVEAVDEGNRVVKWLFVGDGVQDQTIMTVSMRAVDDNADVWDQAMVWYTYKQPDGTFAQVPAQLHPASEILPNVN